MALIPNKNKKEFMNKFFGNIGSDDEVLSKSSQRSNKSSAGGSSGPSLGSAGSYQESNTGSPGAKPVKKLTLKSPDLHKSSGVQKFPKKGINKNPFEKKNQDAGEMKRKIFGSLTSESDTPETPSPRPDKKKIKSSFDECLIKGDHKKEEMDNVTVRRGRDRTSKKKESSDHSKDDDDDLDGILKDSGSEEEDMFAGSDVSIEDYSNKKTSPVLPQKIKTSPVLPQKIKTSPVLPAKSKSKSKLESRDESKKKSSVGTLDSYVRRTSTASTTSIEALAADILADSDDDERFRRELTPSPDIFKTSQSQDKLKSRESSPVQSRASSPIHINKKVLDSPVSDSSSLGSFASNPPSPPKFYQRVSSSQESNTSSSSKKKTKSSQSSSVSGIKQTKSSSISSNEGKRDKSSSISVGKEKSVKSSSSSRGTKEKSSSISAGTREKSSSISGETGEKSNRCPITGLRKKVRSSQSKKLFNCFGSDNEDNERKSTKKDDSKKYKEKDKVPLVESKSSKEPLVESKKTNEKEKDIKSKSSKSSNNSKDEKDNKRLKDKNSFNFDEFYDKEEKSVLDARKIEKNKKYIKSEGSSKTKKTFYETSEEDEETKENIKEKKENVKYYKIPKLEKKDSGKATSASDGKADDSKKGYSNNSSSKAQSSRNCSTFFGNSGSKKSEPTPSTSSSTIGFKFFKKEDIPKKDDGIAYKIVKDENSGKLKQIRVDPSQVKHHKTDLQLGAAGQAALDYCYGVNDPKKTFKYTKPPSLTSSASETEEEESTTQDKNKKSTKSNKKSSKKSPKKKKKKQKNILSYMTVRPDMDEINELLAMKIPRPDEDDGIDVAAIIKRDKDAREEYEKYEKERKEARRKKKQAEEKYEDENAALRDRLEAELTHEKIEEYFKEFKPICEEIWAGEAEWCWRHTQFHKDTNARQGLLYKQILDPFTSDQVETANSHISKIYMKDRTEWFANNHYCDNVLLPEFLVYMYMTMFSLDREEAALRIKKTPLKPEDDHLGVFIRLPDSP